MARGSRSGIILTAGLVSGIIVHTALVAFGISAIIVSVPEAFWAIKIAGAIYMLYLAYQVLRSPGRIDLDTEIDSSRKSVNLYAQGVLMNLLNPKVILFFLAFFPGFIDMNSGNPVRETFILGATFIVQAFVIFSLVALLASTLARRIKDNRIFPKVMKYLQIFVFIAIALLILK